MSEHADYLLKNGVPEALVNADEALSRARHRLEFVITALRANDNMGMELGTGDVLGLVAILEDVNEALVISDSYFHDLNTDVIHGPDHMGKGKGAINALMMATLPERAEVQ